MKGEEIVFLTANIDRAIVMTQFDLRGFYHPLGFREEERNAKSFEAIAWNMVAVAAGLGHGNRQPTDKTIVDYFKSDFGKNLKMCRKLARDCDLFAKEAIKLIVEDIIKQHGELVAEVASGKREPCVYIRPLEKGNCWGDLVLALAQAFKVKLPARKKAA